ncbi:MAG: hypothetical protein ABW098_18030, partial [Candidatus Thiodiazotropha sp.]
MITAACYAEIGLAAGPEWDPGRLEELIDGKDYGEFTGRYRRLFRGIVPNNESANFFETELDYKCNIVFWRDHPFWTLLVNHPITHKDIELALMSVKSNVRRYIWGESPRRNKKTQTRGIRVIPSRESIEKIAKYKNLDSLIALVAYAREGRDSGILQEYVMSASHSLRIFPDVIARNPHLYICWKPLARRLKSLIWQPKPSFVLELK